jgi:hypothetical protein
MGLVRRGYLSISEAYEKIVATLEPPARPSDDYLLSLDEDERDAALDSAHDAEKRAEKLFADALANKQLTRWRMLDDGTIRVSVVEEWKPSDLDVPGLDSDSPDFTDSSDGDGSMICIDMKQLNGWLRTQLAVRRDTGS